jgi:hypothetical protein
MAKQKTVDPIIQLGIIVDETVHAEGLQPDAVNCRRSESIDYYG